MTLNKESWLKILLVIWLMAGVVWFGYTLPKLSSGHAASDVSEIPISKSHDLAKGIIELPINVVAEKGVENVFLTEQQSNSFENVRKTLVRNKITLNILSYYHPDESKNLADIRANTLINAITGKSSLIKSFFTIETIQSSDIKTDGKFLYDIFDFSLDTVLLSNNVIANVISEDGQFDIASSINVDNCLNRMRINPDLMIFLKLSAPQAFKNIQENRSLIQAIKSQFINLGIPSFKLIAEIDEKEEDSEGPYALSIDFQGNSKR